MKGFHDSLVEHTLQTPLTEYDRRLIGALAQGYTIAQARQVDGVKKGISPTHALRVAKQALIKLNIDISKIEENPAAWCYENAYTLSRMLNRRYLDMHPHNDARDNRQDKAFGMQILTLALEGKNRPEIIEALDASTNSVNNVMTVLRNLLVECYLEDEEKDLRTEFWIIWGRWLGPLRVKHLLSAVRTDWRTHERIGPFYRRKISERDQNRARQASSG